VRAFFDKEAHAAGRQHPYRIVMGGVEHCLTRKEMLEHVAELHKALDDGWLAGDGRTPTAPEDEPTRRSTPAAIEGVRVCPSCRRPRRQRLDCTHQFHTLASSQDLRAVTDDLRKTLEESKRGG
jgi:hypothetical protein